MDLTVGRNCHWRKAKKCALFVTTEFLSTKITQVHDTGKVGQRDHEEIAERKGKAIRKLPQGLLKKKPKLL